MRRSYRYGQPVPRRDRDIPPGRMGPDPPARARTLPPRHSQWLSSAADAPNHYAQDRDQSSSDQKSQCPTRSRTIAAATSVPRPRRLCDPTDRSPNPPQTSPHDFYADGKVLTRRWKARRRHPLDKHRRAASLRSRPTPHYTHGSGEPALAETKRQWSRSKQPSHTDA